MPGLPWRQGGRCWHHAAPRGTAPPVLGAPTHILWHERTYQRGHAPRGGEFDRCADSRTISVPRCSICERPHRLGAEGLSDPSANGGRGACLLCMSWIRWYEYFTHLHFSTARRTAEGLSRCTAQGVP